MRQLSNVLIVEDDADWLDIYSTELASEEYNVTSARTVKRAANLLAQHEFSVVATDLKLLGADIGGFDILEMVRERSPDTQVIIFTGVGGKQDAFEAMRRGAYDYITKPLDYNHVKRVIKSAIEVREQKLSYRRNAPKSLEISLPFPEKFVGSSQVIKQVLRQVATVIETTKPVLIWGPPGTGKALIAETIHLASQRKRFVLVNCPSFSETTLERTLFGFEKDAFPGAFANEPGLLEHASGGTLVLDKVSDLSPRLQNQLLAALRHQRVRRIGSSQAVDVDLRVLATSQVDLTAHVAQHLFSKELYEYLGDTSIALPALKERKDEQTDDVLLLTGYFLDKHAQGDGPLLTISDEAKNLLQTYDFPENVRELEEAVRLAITQARSGMIEPLHLPERIQRRWRMMRLAEVTRGPVPESMICPHGYSLTDQGGVIAQAFDTENYVYLSGGSDVPAWYQAVVEEILAQFGLKTYVTQKLHSGGNICPICQPILSSCLAILNISTSNPTVFYALGLAHAIGLPCAVLKEKKSQLTEEFESLDLLEYDDEASLKKSISTWLNHLIFSSTE